MSTTRIITESNPSYGVILWSLFCYLLLPICLVWYLYWRLANKRLIELANKIPGIDGFPLLGCAIMFRGSSHDIFKRILEKSKYYKNVMKIWLGPRLFVFLENPKDVELVLTSNIHIDKSPDYQLLKPWLGDGLLISTGDKWRTHRKIISPTFHLNVLKSYIDLFNKNSKDVVQKLAEENGKTFDCHDYMSEATVEILLETVMGVSKKTQQSGYDYAMAVMKLCGIIHFRHAKLWLQPDFIFNLTSYGRIQDKLIKTIHNLTSKILKIKKEAFASGIRGSIADVPKDSTQYKVRKENVDHSFPYRPKSGLKVNLDDLDDDVGEKERMSFLDQLIEASQNGFGINDKEIKEQVDTIMFEGHDTTAAASSFFLCMMGIHQYIQDKVIQELDRIFGNSDRPATFNDTLEMKYLERCMLETLRLYPPVPIIARQLKEELKLASTKLILPAGCTVIIPQFRIHRLESIYPNSEKFDPDNFLPERCVDRNYYTFIPFSAGPRSCVGRKYAMLKLKILLSTVLRNFRVYSDDKENDFKLQGDMILKRSEGFKIRLKPRKKIV